jgi:thioredoxin 1
MKGSGKQNLRHAIPVMVLIAMLGTACGSLPTPTPTPQVPSAAVTPIPAATRVAPLPAQPAGTAKPIFVEFYTTWCAPCKQMEPTIARLEDEYGSRVDFQILDAAGATEEKIKYRYVSQPQVVLVDRQGKIVDTVYGLQGYDGLKGLLDRLLAMP